MYQRATTSLDRIIISSASMRCKYRIVMLHHWSIDWYRWKYARTCTVTWCHIHSEIDLSFQLHWQRRRTQLLDTQFSSWHFDWSDIFLHFSPCTLCNNYASNVHEFGCIQTGFNTICETIRRAILVSMPISKLVSYQRMCDTGHWNLPLILVSLLEIAEFNKKYRKIG